MAQPIDFSDFAGRVIEIYDTNRYARKTLVRMKQVLRELADLGVASTSELTTATMAGYVKSKGADANSNTTNGLLGAIASACSYAVEEGWLDRSPAWRRVRLRETRMQLNRPRSYEEICRLLDHAFTYRERSWESRRICAMAWLVALTGVRLGEATYGEAEDLRLAGPDPKFHVNPARHPRTRLKTLGSERHVPLAQVLVTVLSDWLPHSRTRWIFPGVRRKGPWTGGTYGRTKAIDQLKSLAAEVGIDRITWHSLRHAFGTNALERWEVPLRMVQQIMGHTDMRTTQRYLHTEGSPAIAAAMRGIGYRRPA